MEKGGIIYSVRTVLKDFEKLDFSKDDTRITITKEDGLDLVTVAFNERLGNSVEEFIDSNSSFCQFKNNHSSESLACKGNILVIENNLFPFVACILSEVFKKEKNRFENKMQKSVDDISKVVNRITRGTDIRSSVFCSKGKKTIRVVLFYKKRIKVFASFDPQKSTGLFKKVNEWTKDSVKSMKKIMAE